MYSVQMFIKIGTMKSFIKLDVKDGMNRVGEVGSGLANEVNRATLINKEVIITLVIGESTVA